MQPVDKSAPLCASEWRGVFCPVFGEGAAKLLGTRLFASACPECAAVPDPLYGWQPLCRPVWDLPSDPRFVLKEQCFSCGYHKAVWIGNEWTEEERQEAFDFIVFIKHFKETSHDGNE